MTYYYFFFVGLQQSEQPQLKGDSLMCWYIIDSPNDVRTRKHKLIGNKSAISFMKV